MPADDEPVGKAHGNNFTCLMCEANYAIDFGKKSVVFAATNILAGLQTRAPLAHDNRSAGDQLSPESLYSQPLCV